MRSPPRAKELQDKRDNDAALCRMRDRAGFGANRRGSADRFLLWYLDRVVDRTFVSRRWPLVWPDSNAGGPHSWPPAHSLQLRIN